MSTALLDSGASHNFIAQPQLQQFAQNSLIWRWAKPLQVRLADKSTVISSKVANLQVQMAPGSDPVAIEFRVVPKLNHPIIFGMAWFAEFNPVIDWHQRTVTLNLADALHTVHAPCAD